MRAMLHGRSVELYAMVGVSDELPAEFGRCFMVPFTPLRSREGHCAHGCFDCGAEPRFLVREEDGTGWLWCGRCDIGG